MDRTVVVMPDYFSHDYGARNDPKLIKLQMEMGMEGIGIFWCLIEMMYEQSGYLLQSHYDRIAFAFRVDNDKIRRVVECFDLFETDDVGFWNESCRNRLKIRASKSDAARNSANTRWLYERNANAMRPKCSGNAIKESKVKKESKIYTTDFECFWKEYPRRKDKGHAFIEWNRQIKSTDPQVIIEGAKKYATECRENKTEERYIKMGQGWLSGQRWTDERQPTTLQQNETFFPTGCWRPPQNAKI